MKKYPDMNWRIFIMFLSAIFTLALLIAAFVSLVQYGDAGIYNWTSFICGAILISAAAAGKDE